MTAENPTAPAYTQGQAEDEIGWIRDILDGVFALEDITAGLQKGKTIRLRGRFVIDSGRAYELLAPMFRSRGRQVRFRRDRTSDIILVVDRPARLRQVRWWPPVALACLTMVSMLASRAVPWGDPDLSWRTVLQNLPDAMAFTGCLLAILVVHELGHFFAARRFGVAVSLPYLIPFPFSLFGTLGAIILMREVPPHRRALFIISAAGPLAGFLVALPVLVAGLFLSTVEPLPLNQPYLLEGNSLLYALTKLLVFGRWLPAAGEDVLLHPVASAGWVGLWITSLNLIPGAQLDGGHIAQALLGDKARYVTWGVICLALVLSVGWRGWLVWAILLFAISRIDARPADDVTPLTRGHILLALALLLLFLLTFTPWPLRIVDPAGNLGLVGAV